MRTAKQRAAQLKAAKVSAAKRRKFKSPIARNASYAAEYGVERSVVVKSKSSSSSSRAKSRRAMNLDNIKTANRELSGTKADRKKAMVDKKFMPFTDRISDDTSIDSYRYGQINKQTANKIKRAKNGSAVKRKYSRKK